MKGLKGKLRISCAGCCKWYLDKPDSSSIRKHTYSVRSIRRLNTDAVKQEADSACLLALTIAEGIHELLELRSALYLEENLIVVVRDLDVELRRGMGITAGGHLTVFRRHGCRVFWRSERDIGT